VVGPAVERKIGSNAMSQLAIDATNFRTASWAASNGLYAEVFDDVEALDAGVERLTNSLSGQSMDAMKALKKVFWQGTDHWGELLLERAAISGSLVLRAEAKAAIAHIKSQLGG
jgi:methylglutaconyl-CoA hydratase